MWERACPRWRCISRRMYRLKHRHRGQARSHTSPLPQGGFVALAIDPIPAPPAPLPHPAHMPHPPGRW
ncbi:hypothetical protein FIV37_27835 [Pseudomonas gessardii]|nr:hypothetical protein [Pseudomonas gessardii]